VSVVESVAALAVVLVVESVAGLVADSAAE
jgi:hypothetical protein